MGPKALAANLVPSQEIDCDGGLVVLRVRESQLLGLEDRWRAA